MGFCRHHYHISEQNRSCPADGSLPRALSKLEGLLHESAPAQNGAADSSWWMQRCVDSRCLSATCSQRLVTVLLENIRFLHRRCSNTIKSGRFDQDFQLRMLLQFEFNGLLLATLVHFKINSLLSTATMIITERITPIFLFIL